MRTELARRVGRFSHPGVSPLRVTRRVAVRVAERVRESERERDATRDVRESRRESDGVGVRLLVSVLSRGER